MNKDRKPKESDEIGSELETGDEVNAAIKQQGDEAAAGILRDTDAARQEKKKEQAEEGNNKQTGAR